MTYWCSQKNRLEKPVDYMYAEFQGPQFLKKYLTSRTTIANVLKAVENANISFDQLLVVKALPLFSDLIRATSSNAEKSFLALIDSRDIKLSGLTDAENNLLDSHAKDLVKNTTDESVTTLKLLHELISAQLADTTNPHTRVWLDRLVKRFEVTKKIYDSYQAGFRKGNGENTSVRLYWLFALALCLFYVHTHELKYLNSLLKVNDLLCSLPEGMLRGNIPTCGMSIVIASEVVSIQLLAEKKGVLFASK